MKKLLLVMLVTVCLIACLCACDFVKHEHILLGWEFTDELHWQGVDCTLREKCDIEVNYQPHIDKDNNNVCDDCGYDGMTVNADDATENDHPGSTHLWHTECEYCGKLDGEKRWFIAEVVSASMVKPLGKGCFEAISAGEAGNSLNVNGFADGDIVRITYGGYIMESYPVQIHADSIEPVE